MGKKKKEKQIRPRLDGSKKINFEFFNNEESRVLVIGDLHAPFDLDSYFDHCVDVYERYNCNRVVFIGDVIDNHYSSYHETDANGLGGGSELELAIKRLARYYHRFPDAYVTVGNHDRIIMRKAQSGGVPSAWVKDYKDVLNTPNWDFVTSIEIDGVMYIHGEAGTARTKAQAYTEYYVGANSRVFGTQVGCGIDAKSYAMAYMKVGKKPAIGCAVVLGGKTAINELMVL